MREAAELREQLDAAMAEREELVATHETTINEMKQAQAQEVLAVRKRLDEARALELEMSEPDQDAIDNARKAYDALPAEKRPPTLVDWWKGLDEKTTPKTLRLYRKAADTEAEPEPAPKVPVKPAGPTSGPRGGRPNGTKVSAESVMDTSSDAYKQIFGSDS